CRSARIARFVIFLFQQNRWRAERFCFVRRKLVRRSLAIGGKLLRPLMFDLRNLVGCRGLLDLRAAVRRKRLACLRRPNHPQRARDDRNRKMSMPTRTIYHVRQSLAVFAESFGESLFIAGTTDQPISPSFT